MVKIQKRVKRIIATLLAAFLVMTQLPTDFYRVMAFDGYHNGNDVIEVITEKESQASEAVVDPVTGEAMQLPEHILKVNTTVDGESLEPLDLNFTKDDPGKTIVKALEGYELVSVSLDTVATTEAMNIVFDKEKAETKVLDVVVKKVVEEEPVQPQSEPVNEEAGPSAGEEPVQPRASMRKLLARDSASKVNVKIISDDGVIQDYYALLVGLIENNAPDYKGYEFVSATVGNDKIAQIGV